MKTEIEGIRFSLRETDIISCIVTGKSVKTIAIILGISPYTVNSHVRNICAKIGCSTQKEIINFVENSSNYQDIYQRYIAIILNAEFEQILRKIARKEGDQRKECIIFASNYSEFNKLKDCLTMAGIKTSVTTKNNPPDTKNVRYIICSSETSVFDRKEALLWAEKFDAPDERCIAYGLPSNFYYAALVCLKKIYGSDNLDEEINCFKQYYENKVFKSAPQHVPDIQKNKSKKIFFPSFIIIGILMFLFAALQYYGDQKIITNVMTMPDKTYMRRSDIEGKVDFIFSKRAPIKIIQLYGCGGAGKTTLARKYISVHKKSICWEINAETEDSIICSLYKLASLFIKNRADDFSKSDDSFGKDKTKLIAFIASKCKAFKGWILLFDNVDDFRTIKDFLPRDEQIWGNGTVIITTRNANIKNSVFLNSENTVFVDQLDETDKLQLFNKICFDGAALSAEETENERNFLNYIPSMPLDITAAACYIKATNTSYKDYLDKIGFYGEKFDKIQSGILSENPGYDFTRYGIVKTTVTKLLSGNAIFRKALLNLSLLDANGISKAYICNDKLITDDFLYNLQKHSFIRNNGENVSLHRFTQELALICLKEVLNYKEKEQYVDELIERITPYNKIAWYLYDNFQERMDAQTRFELMQHLLSFNNKIHILESNKDRVESYKIKTDLALLHTYKYMKSDFFLKQFSESIIKRNDRYKVLNNADFAVLLEICAAKCLHYYEYKKAKTFIKRCLDLCDKTPNTLCVKAICLADAGIISDTEGKFDETKQYLNLALKLISSGKETWKLQTKVTVFNRYYNNYANHYVMSPALLQVVDIALSILRELKADKFFHEDDTGCDPDKVVSIFILRRKLAALYNRTGEFDKALKCEKESAFIVQKIKRQKIPVAGHESTLLLDFGCTFLRKNEVLKAHQFLTNAINAKIKNKDNSGLLYAYMYRAEANLKLNKLEEAYDDCLESIKVKGKYNNNSARFSEAACRYYMAVIEFKRQNHAAALEHLNGFRAILNEIAKDIFTPEQYRFLKNSGILENSFKSCEEGLRKAIEIFRVTYGKEHSFVNSFAQITTR